MTGRDILLDAFGRIPEMVQEAIDGLGVEELTFRLDGEANTIAWLIWHLSRIEDDHVAGVAGREQVWTSGGWARRFKLPLADADMGYGHTAEQVASVKADAKMLGGYFEAVHEMTMEFVGTVTDSDLDRVVDERWDPPVTLGVRLVSVVGHDYEQAGQAAFIRGILDRKGRTGPNRRR